ncbi:MAG TPA: hypothetical protein VE975_02665 [Actinomycetota bacterium]|jgi:hypothetical protein|nr:hypothetical protein [Actinomycetota bacterium]
MWAGYAAVPLHFTVELIGLLVLLGGALLVPPKQYLFTGGRAGRAFAAVGLIVLAGAQVAHGGRSCPPTATSSCPS